MSNRRSILLLPLLACTLVACDDSTAPAAGELSVAEASALAMAIDNSSNSALESPAETEGVDTTQPPSEDARAASTRTDDFLVDVPCPRGGAARLSGESVLVIDSEEGFITFDVEATQAHSACTFRSGEGIDITIEGTLSLVAKRELREGLQTASQSHTGSLDYATSTGKRGSCAVDLTTEFSLVPGEMTRSILGTVCGHAVDVTTSWTQES